MSVGKSISAIFAWATHAWAEEPRRRPEDLALDLFDTLIVQGNPTLESLERTARARGWAKLTAQETTKLVRPLGIIPGVHTAWRVTDLDSRIILEVGGTGGWSRAKLADAEARGERLQAPPPGAKDLDPRDQGGGA